MRKAYSLVGTLIGVAPSIENIPPATQFALAGAAAFMGWEPEKPKDA